jgi:hypothetical protein
MNRPKIHKRRRGYDYKSLIRGSILSGLLKEAKYSNSTIKLYAMLTMEAILADSPLSLQRSFQKELEKSGFKLTYEKEEV